MSETDGPAPPDPGRRRFLKVLALFAIAWLLLGLGFASWLVLGAAGPPFVSSRSTDGASQTCFRLTQDHIDILHDMRVRWDPLTESGMASLELKWTQGLKAFANELGLAISRDRKRALASAFQIFLAFADSSPGRYPLAPGDVTGVGEAAKLPPLTEFTLTRDHLALLRHARGKWLESLGALGIDPKRPFGDRTSFELDMADILAIKPAGTTDGHPDLTPEQFKTLNALFVALPHALAAFLKTASLKPSLFCKIEDGVWAPH